VKRTQDETPLESRSQRVPVTFHWQRWLVVMLLLGLIPVIVIPLWQVHQLWRIADELSSPQVQFFHRVAEPRKLYELFNDRLGVELSIMQVPGAVYCRAIPVGAGMFDKLCYLNLEHFLAERIVFNPSGLEKFVKFSPRLRVIRLHESQEITPKFQSKLESIRPGLVIIQNGLITPMLPVEAHPDGLQIRPVGSPFSGFKRRTPGMSFAEVHEDEILTELEGKPIGTYHEVRRAISTLKPGESLRFTVRVRTGVEREEVFRKPEP